MANIRAKKVKATDLELKDRLVAIQRVTKVTKGGRHFSFAAIVVVGDEKGVVGYGLGKAGEVTSAISKGIERMPKRIFTAYPSAGRPSLTRWRQNSAERVCS